MKSRFNLNNRTLTVSAIAMGLILWSLLLFANSEQNRSQMQPADAQASSSSAREVTVRLPGLDSISAALIAALLYFGSLALFVPRS